MAGIITAVNYKILHIKSAALTSTLGEREWHQVSAHSTPLFPAQPTSMAKRTSTSKADTDFIAYPGVNQFKRDQKNLRSASEPKVASAQCLQENFFFRKGRNRAVWVRSSVKRTGFLSKGLTTTF